MLEHLEAAQTILAAPAVNIDNGKLLGSVGSGGLALALTGALIAGIREPKGDGGGKKAKIRRKLTSTQATILGITAGTCYIAAGSIWTASGNLSEAFASIFTSGAFGNAGLGAVSALLAALMYFREMRPGMAAITGIIAAGVWSQAGGIWGLPETLVTTTARALGAA